MNSWKRARRPERRDALLKLIAARAEKDLTHCLASANPTVVQLAITGLWECWLDEEGAEARKQIESGTDAMNDGDLEAAAASFTRLMAEHPHWAEAVNKQATVLYLQGRPEDSIALCRRVVALKPDHFGAWNGLALCAIQTEDWNLALEAVRESLRLAARSRRSTDNCSGWWNRACGKPDGRNHHVRPLAATPGFVGRVDRPLPGPF